MWRGRGGWLSLQARRRGRDRLARRQRLRGLPFRWPPHDLEDRAHRRGAGRVVERRADTEAEVERAVRPVAAGERLNRRGSRAIELEASVALGAPRGRRRRRGNPPPRK